MEDSRGSGLLIAIIYGSGKDKVSIGPAIRTLLYSTRAEKRTPLKATESRNFFLFVRYELRISSRVVNF